MSKELVKRIKVNGHTFELEDYGDGDVFYQCRGEVMYDDEHDEMPEPSLWEAAKRLTKILEDDGHRADYDHSEKGWVEVTILG